jgi:uncharacterized DUF497 family protein
MLMVAYDSAMRCNGADSPGFYHRSPLIPITILQRSISEVGAPTDAGFLMDCVRRRTRTWCFFLERWLGPRDRGGGPICFEQCPVDSQVQQRYTIRVGSGIDFDWDDGNVQHIALHGITPAEAEEVILNDPVDLDSETVDGEERMINLGLTNRGRLLIVVSTMRQERVRVVTAFRAPKGLEILYLKEKGL